MGMDFGLEISDDRRLKDTNANLAFCYPPPPTLHALEIPPVLSRLHFTKPATSLLSLGIPASSSFVSTAAPLRHLGFSLVISTASLAHTRKKEDPWQKLHWQRGIFNTLSLRIIFKTWASWAPKTPGHARILELLDHGLASPAWIHTHTNWLSTIFLESGRTIAL
ncbi:hypothetical protein MRB53_028173 [Persea americana]|uniref:Uncharacterized protein n=1 Tax=Persea americana TaxID=3435 RepID=A0ACC2KES1_PERAE|nr:hypothetical protein MRB53_028173 [Persea americana]